MEAESELADNLSSLKYPENVFQIGDNENEVAKFTAKEKEVLRNGTERQISSERTQLTKKTLIPQYFPTVICEVCEAKYNDEKLLLHHKLVNHGMPFDMARTHLPGHRSCVDCRRHFAQNVDQDLAVFLSTPCLQCTPDKCYSCNTCKNHFHMSNFFKINITSTVQKQLNIVQLPQSFEIGNRQEKLRKTNTGKAEKCHIKVPCKLRTKVREKLSCSLCGRNFKVMSALSKHLKIHSREKPFVCSFCENSFTSKRRLFQHRKIHSVNALHHCYVCGRCFTQRQSLTVHLEAHSGDKPNVWDVGGKKITFLCGLTKHNRIHSGEKPYKCGDCGKEFTGNGAYRRHLLMHKGIKKFKCVLCPKAFYTNGELSDHVDGHTGRNCTRVVKRAHCCDVCGKSFHMLSNLKAHSHVHTGELLYQCDQCGKSFTTMYGMKKHVKSLHTEKTLPCPVCGKMYPTQSHLDRHHQAHTAEKPFQCDECGKAFKEKKYLIRHRYRHTGESPFVCEGCSKGFSTASYCKSHQKKCRLYMYLKSESV